MSPTFPCLIINSQADKKRHTIIYSNSGDLSDGKEKLFIGAFTYNEGKYSHDVINYNGDADGVKFLPAKPGFLMIMEYFKKEKRVNMKLSKIDY